MNDEDEKRRLRAVRHLAWYGKLPQTEAKEPKRLPSSRDWEQYYSIQPISLGESDPNKFPDRAPRKAAITDIEDEPQEDDARIEAAFEEGPRYLQDDRKVKGDKKASHDDKRPLEFLKLRCNRGGVECSILDRERGYIHKPGDLPDELSYPFLCGATFNELPKFNWAFRTAAQEEKYRRSIFKHLSPMIPLNKLPRLGSPKTIKKEMNTTNSHWSKLTDRYFFDKNDMKRLEEYGPHILAMLKEAPGEGWYALMALANINPKFTKPTSKELKIYLSGCCSRFNDQEESSSERSDWFELLERHKVIMLYKCVGPHQDYYYLRR